MAQERTGGRLPPHNAEAEQSVLGCMLLDAESVAIALERLKDEDFYRPQHQEIFRAMAALYEAGQPVDLVTVVDELYRRGSVEGVGGLEYITELSRFVPSTANVRSYVEIIADHSLMRRLIKASGDISQQAYEASGPAQGVMEFAEKQIFDLSLGRTANALVHIKPTLLESLAQIEDIYSHKSRITGVPTGFADIDYKTSGMHPAELILIAARPSMGKTSYAMNIVQNAAVKNHETVAVFSLEMSRDQLVNRLLCAEALVELQKVRTGDLTDKDWQKLTLAMAPLSQAPIYIDDTPGITVLEMRSKCRRLKLEKGLSLVVIDYLQLMSGSGAESRQQEISAISRSLKQMARELEVPVIALSQLSRAPEARQDHRPMLSDLRESGAIEQDADVVMFLYRDEYYNAESEDRNIAELIIAKQRNGPTGTVKLLWQGQYTRFMDLARDWQG